MNNVTLNIFYKVSTVNIYLLSTYDLSLLLDALEYAMLRVWILLILSFSFFQVVKAMKSTPQKFYNPNNNMNNHRDKVFCDVSKRRRQLQRKILFTKFMPICMHCNLGFQCYHRKEYNSNEMRMKRRCCV